MRVYVMRVDAWEVVIVEVIVYPDVLVFCVVTFFYPVLNMTPFVCTHPKPQTPNPNNMSCMRFVTFKYAGPFLVSCAFAGLCVVGAGFLASNPVVLRYGLFIALSFSALFLFVAIIHIVWIRWRAYVIQNAAVAPDPDES